MVAVVLCKLLVYSEIVSIWALVSLAAYPPMEPDPLRTTEMICDSDMVLVCSDGPAPPSPERP